MVIHTKQAISSTLQRSREMVGSSKQLVRSILERKGEAIPPTSTPINSAKLRATGNPIDAAKLKAILMSQPLDTLTYIRVRELLERAQGLEAGELKPFREQLRTITVATIAELDEAFGRLEEMHNPEHRAPDVAESRGRGDEQSAERDLSAVVSTGPAMLETAAKTESAAELARVRETETAPAPEIVADAESVTAPEKSAAEGATQAEGASKLEASPDPASVPRLQASWQTTLSKTILTVVCVALICAVDVPVLFFGQPAWEGSFLPSKELSKGLTPREAAIARAGVMFDHGFQLPTFVLVLLCVHLGSPALRKLSNAVLLLAISFNGPHGITAWLGPHGYSPDVLAAEVFAGTALCSLLTAALAASLAVND